MLESICLHILHLIFYLTTSLAHRWSQLDRRKPYPLKAARAKTPSHLALLLVKGKNIIDDVPDAVIVENVAQTISWCQDIGIGKLTIFANQGNDSTHPLPPSRIHISTLWNYGRACIWLSSINSNKNPTKFCRLRGRHRLWARIPFNSPSIWYFRLQTPFSRRSCRTGGYLYIYSWSSRVQTQQTTETGLDTAWKYVNIYLNYVSSGTDAWLEAKEAPPSRTALTIHMISRESSKPAIASVASHYTRMLGRRSRFSMSIAELNGVLEGTYTMRWSTDQLWRNGNRSTRGAIAWIYDCASSIMPRCLGASRVARISSMAITINWNLVCNLTPFDMGWRWIISCSDSRTKPSLKDWWRNLFSTSSLLITEENLRDALDEFAKAEIRLGK